MKLRKKGEKSGKKIFSENHEYFVKSQFGPFGFKKKWSRDHWIALWRTRAEIHLEAPKKIPARLGTVYFIFYLKENFFLHKFLKRKVIFSDITNRAEGLNEMRSRGVSENYILNKFYALKLYIIWQ